MLRREQKWWQVQGVIHVVSTGLSAPTREKCKQSVRMQVGVEFVHHYVEASEQTPPRDVITNLASVFDELPPDAVCVLLDGDDWLITDRALSLVTALHDQGAWVTYGSFEYADGRPGWAAPYPRGVEVRKHPWLATHLKSIRAGLFQRLRDEDRVWPSGTNAPWDQIIMFAAIEQAGWDRVRFLDVPVVAYNLATSNEWKNGPDEERTLEKLVRARAPYERIAAL